MRNKVRKALIALRKREILWRIKDGFDEELVALWFGLTVPAVRVIINTESMVMFNASDIDDDLVRDYLDQLDSI